METATGKKKNTMYYLQVLIYFAITFGIGFLPPFGQITELGMRVLGVFIGVIYGWIALGLSWPSMFALIALALVGYTGITEAYTSGFGYYLIPTIMITFLIAACLNKTGITEWLASWLMARKIIVGRPYILMAVLLYGVEVLAIMQAGFVGLFMIWEMAVSLAEQAGMPKHNPFVSFMIPALTVVYVLGTFLLPFAQGSIMYLSFFQQGMGFEFPQFGYIVWHVVVINLYVVIVLLIAKFAIRLDLSSLTNTIEAYKDKEVPKMNRNQKVGLVSITLFLLVLLLPIFLPSEWPLIGLINSLGILGVGSLLVIFLLIYRNEDGVPMTSIGEISQGIHWDVMWLLIATTPLAAAFNAEECGIMNTIMGFLTPILTSMSPALFIIVCSLLIGIASQFMHNLVLVIVFVPILVPLCMQLGGNPYACYLAIYWAAGMAFATPAASMNAALIFGHPSLEPKDGYFNGILHFILGMATCYIIGLPLANILF